MIIKNVLKFYKNFNRINESFLAFHASNKEIEDFTKIETWDNSLRGWWGNGTYVARPKKHFDDWKLIQKFKNQGIGHGYILRINCSWDNLVNIDGDEARYPKQYKKMMLALKELTSMNLEFKKEFINSEVSRLTPSNYERKKYPNSYRGGINFRALIDIFTATVCVDRKTIYEILIKHGIYGFYTDFHNYGRYYAKYRHDDRHYDDDYEYAKSFEDGDSWEIMIINPAIIEKVATI